MITFILVVWLALTGFANAPDSRQQANVKQAGATNNCELNILRLHDVNVAAGKDGLVIAIARLGDGEQSRILNRRRLHNIQTYLKSTLGRTPETIITAEGERVKGTGRVEIYVRGKLMDRFEVGRSEDIYVGSCDGTAKEENKLFYDARRGKSH